MRSSKTKAVAAKPVNKSPVKGQATITDDSTKQAPAEEAEALAEDSIFGPKTLRSPRGSMFANNGSAVSASPSHPTFPPEDRRFSDVYGHGYLLQGDNLLTPTHPATGSKRKTSGSNSEVSPKRVRFSSSKTNDEPEVQLCQDLSMAQKDLALDDEFLSLPDFHLLTALSDATESLSINQISSLFRILQKLTGHFAATFFAKSAEDNDELVGADMQNFPFEDLELKHHALFLTTVNILDASTTDEVENQSHIRNTKWLKFFAHPNYRPFLVTAILGEWFTQRIFKDTAFGLSEKGRKHMEEKVDKQYIHFDSFVRAKRRSAVVARHRKKNDADFWLQEACANLADELMVLLAPMMPFFAASDPHNEYLSPEDADHKEEIWFALVELVRHCAALNLAIVRTGENGTIVRPANNLPKGNPYYPTAPMECVNLGMCESAHDTTQASKDERLVVKMTCWPRMEAWVPHGLDRVEMSMAEIDARLNQLPIYLSRKVQRGEELTTKELEVARSSLFCWDCFDLENYWDVLPQELWRIHKQHEQKREMLRKSYEARMKIERAQRKKDGGDDDDGSNHSDSGASASTDSSVPSSGRYSEATIKAEGENEDAPRGSWVTEYTCLAKHQVYCEWEKPASHDPAEIRKSKVESVNSLHNAIRDARNNLASPYSVLASTDDLLVKLWNFYAAYNVPIEWGTFVVAAAIYHSRYGIPGASLVTLPVRLTARILDGACEVLGVKGLSRGVVGLASNIAHGLPAAFGADAQWNPGQFHVPTDMLKDANSYLDSNLGVFRTVLWNVVAPFKGALSTATEQGKSGFSDGLSSMTQFVGQQKQFTNNPIVIRKIAGFKSAVSSAIPQLDGTLEPAAAASFSSAAAAFAAHVTPAATLLTNLGSHHGLQPVPNSIDFPILGDADELVGEAEPSTTFITLTETDTVLATPVQTSDVDAEVMKTTVQSHAPGMLHNAASKVANAAGDLFFGRKPGRTITVKPGETITRMMARGNYQVV